MFYFLVPFMVALISELYPVAYAIETSQPSHKDVKSLLMVVYIGEGGFPRQTLVKEAIFCIQALQNWGIKFLPFHEQCE